MHPIVHWWYGCERPSLIDMDDFWCAGATLSTCVPTTQLRVRPCNCIRGDHEWQYPMALWWGDGGAMHVVGRPARQRGSRSNAAAA